MRSPLALVEVDNPQGNPDRIWKVFRTAASARGCIAYRIVWIRKPRPKEEMDVTACLQGPGCKTYRLWKLLT